MEFTTLKIGEKSKVILSTNWYKVGEYIDITQSYISCKSEFNEEIWVPIHDDLCYYEVSCYNNVRIKNYDKVSCYNNRFNKKK